jgi:hypothetical protein
LGKWSQSIEPRGEFALNCEALLSIGDFEPRLFQELSSFATTNPVTQASNGLIEREIKPILEAEEKKHINKKF